ncbi:MAG: DUF4124 domain-containing protein [Deltaproteobacteria bacterium]
MKFKTSRLLIFSFIFAVFINAGFVVNPPGSHAGEIYRWVDEKGDVHYSDTAPVDSSSKGQKTKSIYIDDSPSVEKEPRGSPQKQKKSNKVGTASSKEVIIYTLDT